MWNRLAVVIASCAGVGFLRWAPGTAGALVGTALALLTELAPGWQWGLTLGIGLAGLVVIPAAQRALSTRDPREVVLDEVFGALITFLGLPMTSATILVGFAAFRLFDIVKPLPIRRLEQLPGAWGVLADDLAAGLFAHLAAWLVALGGL